MGGKKKVERFTEAVNIPCDTENMIDDFFDSDHPVYKFIHAEDLNTQLALLKQISDSLQNISEPCEGDLYAVQLYCEAYFQCHAKNPLKRALASSLQNTPLILREYAVTTLQQFTQKLLKSIETEDLKQLRFVVDNLSSLLENFKMGEECLTELWLEAIGALCKMTNFYYRNTITCKCRLRLLQLMQDCHFTVQTLNKLFQKVSQKVRVLVESEGTQESKKDDLGIQLASDCSVALWNILKDENFFLDARTTCGLGIPLILKMITKDDVVNKIFQELFPKYLQAEIKEERQTTEFSEKATLCLCSGTLAMLESEELVQSHSSGQTLLIDVLGKELLQLVDGLQDSNTKIIASRALVLWSNKARSTVSLTSGCEQCVKVQLYGESEVPKQMMTYAWNHWEDPVDSIRHNAVVIFENIISCDLIAKQQKASSSPFIGNLVDTLLAMSPHVKGRYGPLCCIVGHLGATAIIKKEPQLPHSLLEVMAEQALASYVSELYEKLFVSHLKELKDSENPTPVSEWENVWIEPMLNILSCGNKSQKTYVIEYIVPKVLKCNPTTIGFITNKLSTFGQINAEHLGTVVTCLKRAKMMGILSSTVTKSFDENLWNGVIPERIVKFALAHQDDQIRLDAFGLLCENHKGTEILSEMDLQLVQFFMPLNMGSQAPAFRQHLVALTKKLFTRFRDSSLVLKRQMAAAKKRKQQDVTAEETLNKYKNFLSEIFSELFLHISPRAAFPSRTTTLSVLRVILEVFDSHYRTSFSENEFCILEVITPARIQTLLECMNDTFENNKIETLAILKTLPSQYLYLQNTNRLEAYFMTCLELISSTRPQDGTTAAYLLQVLLMEPSLNQFLVKYNQDLHTKTKHQISRISKGGIGVLQILLWHLKEQVKIARENLLHAAATKPVYPVLHCMRYIMNETNLRETEELQVSRDLVAETITTCFEVARIVSPVVANSSPEGNVPIDSVTDHDISTETKPKSEEEQKMIKDSEKTVNDMPEYLVVCCWRSIKEVSLLLGMLTQKAPIQDPANQKQLGLLTLQQVHEIGAYFKTQLLESRHRGAFELAYAGFVKMTEMLWKCPIAEVQHLPQNWLDEVLTDIKSKDPNSKLCATRRSAGVPFYVQALVGTEPITSCRTSLKKVMTELLELAKPMSPEALTEDTAQVHALNVLRALYKDTRLGEDVFPFIASGLESSIEGYGSQFWAIRNSATLLFSALMTRIFGVKRAKDELSKKNFLTGRVFFNRFPSLFTFLLTKLKEATVHISEKGTLKLHPGLYPVLMVLGRLFPSAMEGIDSNLNISQFIPYVIRCSESPVYKTRLMAARAIHPLVSADETLNVLCSLTEKLPKDHGSLKNNSQNTIHGTLLQIFHISQGLTEIHPDILASIGTKFIPSTSQFAWLCTSQNPCLLTRQVCLEVMSLVLTTRWPSDTAAKTKLEMSTICDIYRTCLLTELNVTHPQHCFLPGHSEFLETVSMEVLANPNLLYDDDPDGGQVIIGVCKCLQSPLYEVRLITLQYLEENLSNCSEKSQEQNKDLVEQLQKSSALFENLVLMMNGAESHPRCLTLVFTVLKMLEMSQHFPWILTTKSFDAEQVFRTLLAFSKSSKRDDITCAAYELSCLCMKALYESDNTTLISDWCKMLKEMSAFEQSDDERCTAAKVLSKNAKILLIDHRGSIGKLLPSLWHVFVKLLQDDDEDVRMAMVQAIVHLQEFTPKEELGKDTGGDPQQMTPNQVLKISLKTLCSYHGNRNPKMTIQILLDWIIEDLEPEWNAEEKQVRLFDKGEMNTYQAEVIFVLNVKRELMALLSKLKTKELLNAEGNDLKVFTNLKDFLANKEEHLQEKILTLTKSVSQITPSVPFLKTSQYQDEVIQLFRLYTALETLYFDNSDKTRLLKEEIMKVYGEGLEVTCYNGLFDSMIGTK